MWKTINSPIIITIIVLVSLFSYDQFRKQYAANEIRGIYDELIAISEDARDDLEKKKLIEGVVKEAAKQFKEGFSTFGDDTKKKKKAEKNKQYFITKSQIIISPPKVFENKKYSNIQKSVVYQVKNTSKDYLSKVAHTIEFYDKGELVNVKDEWGNIKLAPDDTKSYSYTINNSDLKFDTVKISVNDISIVIQFRFFLAYNLIIEMRPNYILYSLSYSEYSSQKKST